MTSASSTDLACTTVFSEDQMSGSEYQQALADQSLVVRICKFFNASVVTKASEKRNYYDEVRMGFRVVYRGGDEYLYPSYFREFTFVNATKLVGSETSTAIQLISAMGRITTSGGSFFADRICSGAEALKIAFDQSQRLQDELPQKWNGFSPIHLAAMHGDLELLKLFREKRPELFFSYDPSAGESPLKIASKLQLSKPSGNVPGIDEASKRLIVFELIRDSFDDWDDVVSIAQANNIQVKNDVIVNTINFAKKIEEGGSYEQCEEILKKGVFLGTFKYKEAKTSLFKLAFEKRNFQAMTILLNIQLGHLVSFASGQNREDLLNVLLKDFSSKTDVKDPETSGVPAFLYYLSIDHKVFFVEFLKRNQSKNQLLLSFYQEKASDEWKKGSWQFKCLEEFLSKPSEPPKTDLTDNSTTPTTTPTTSESNVAKNQKSSSTMILLIVVLAIILALVFLAYYLGYIKF